MGLFDLFVSRGSANSTQTAHLAGERFIIGNWKCHKTSNEARQWLDEFAASYKPDQRCRVVLAPPFTCLESVAKVLDDLKLPGVYLAAQDISPYPRGSYTGAIAATMVQGLADYVIIGHSERRQYFHETLTDVANKLHEALDADLVPIVCVDMPDARSLMTMVKNSESETVIVAYCPAEALQLRIPEPPEKLAESLTTLQALHAVKTVVYGGSVYPDNVGGYLALSNLSGIFVGDASLEVKSFLKIVNAACS